MDGNETDRIDPFSAFDLPLRPVGLFIDGRYFLCSEKEFDWEFALGRYDGFFYHQIKAFEFNRDDADYIKKSNLTTFKVNPSFFRFAFGLKFYLGK
jgi:hypothetical protein